jgi:DNA-binding transcriptional ArsR family regulator
MTAKPARLHSVSPGAAPADGDDVLDDVFAALADPVRRAILMHLEEQDLLVSELARHFDISLQAVSKHIQVLVRAGLVAQERTGRISRCRLTAGPIFEAAVWLNRYSRYWHAQFDTLALWLDEIERRKATRRGSARRNRRDTAAAPVTRRNTPK